MSENQSGYEVLARKYRPKTFMDLVGQDAMVRTLKNAFEAERIAQAFIMTGIRGVGKTTTARIIAKGMNCIGMSGSGGPTIDPCGQCDNCVAIMAGRHVDVIEMDAASRTGVDDIRELIDSSHYRAASARYKIYIIDEVHMLSNNAFNALLKTLEEPPKHVKFIFATTEIRKVPVTVLSRCQRFDLRRIEVEEMIGLLKKIAFSENAAITDDALALITRAAEGSVRDAQSLLDQAISHGAGNTTVDQIRVMLGLADRGRIMDLFDMIMKGDASGALGELGAQYSDGADPLAVLRDLAEITHWVSIVKITPGSADDPTISPDERVRGKELAEKLPIRILTRVWQMLLKALEEVASAPNSMMAAEMAIIRLTHVADLPTPGELIQKLNQAHSLSSSSTNSGIPLGGDKHSQTLDRLASSETTKSLRTSSFGSAVALSEKQAPLHYPTFNYVIELIRSQREIALLMDVENHVKLVKYKPGQIEFEPTFDAPADLAQRLGSRLHMWTGVRWAVSIVNAEGAPTLADQKRAEEISLKQEVAENPIAQAIFSNFPKAKISNIKRRKTIDTEVAEVALPELEDEWDPFEEN